MRYFTNVNINVIIIHLICLEEISEEFEEIIDSSVSIIRKREIISNPQFTQRIFTLLLCAILPELVSQINKRKNKCTFF